MASLQEKAECVTWFIETKSVTTTRRNYQRKYGKVPPSRPSIYRWHKRFVENGTVADGNRSGRPKTQEGTINRIRLEFESSPRTSTNLVMDFGSSVYNSPQGFTQIFENVSI